MRARAHTHTLVSSQNIEARTLRNTILKKLQQVGKEEAEAREEAVLKSNQ